MIDVLRQFYLFLGEANKRFWIKDGSEDQEQIKVVRYLEENGYKFTAIPNSTFTKSKRQKMMNFLMGLRPGLCDLLIVLKINQLLFIEMKKQKGKRGGKRGSVVSKYQKSWIETLNKIKGTEAIVCYGADEAIEKINYYEKL